MARSILLIHTMGPWIDRRQGSCEEGHSSERLPVSAQMENTFGFQAQCQIREPYGRLESSIPLGLGLLTWNGQMARAKDGIVFLQVVRSKRLGPGDFHNFPVPRPCRIYLVEETIQAGPPVMNPLPCCCCCKLTTQWLWSNWSENWRAVCSRYISPSNVAASFCVTLIRHIRNPLLDGG